MKTLSITIKQVKNGFVVTPYHNDSQRMILTEEIHVFQYVDALFQWIRENQGIEPEVVQTDGTLTYSQANPKTQ